MAIPDPISGKSRLRATMRHAIRTVTQDSTTLHTSLDRWLEAHPAAASIATFSALSGEPDLSLFMARHSQRRWLFPRVHGEDLTFHVVKNPDLDLVAGSFGILEPSPALPAFPIDEIDAFLCPGLAFDQHGGRLGRGRGFYDRLLARARPDAQKIGVCFPNQIVPDTFMEAHDIRMDEVFW